MNEIEFDLLKAQIHQMMLKLEEFQQRYIKETGRRYAISGPISTQRDFDENPDENLS